MKILRKIKSHANKIFAYFSLFSMVANTLAPLAAVLPAYVYAEDVNAPAEVSVNSDEDATKDKATEGQDSVDKSKEEDKEDEKKEASVEASEENTSETEENPSVPAEENGTEAENNENVVDPEAPDIIEGGGVSDYRPVADIEDNEAVEVIDIPMPEVVPEVEAGNSAPVESIEAPSASENVVKEKEYEYLEEGAEVKDSVKEDWSIDGEVAKTIEKVKLGVKYVFPLDEEVSVTFKKLPKLDEDRGYLKIERVKVEDLKLPDDFETNAEYAFDITIVDKNGNPCEDGLMENEKDFEYDLTLPKPKGVEVGVVYIEKDLEEVKEEKLKTEEIKEIEEDKVDQKKDGEKVEVGGLDHFTIYIATYHDSGHTIEQTQYHRGENVVAYASGLPKDFYRIDIINPSNLSVANSSSDTCNSKSASVSYTYRIKDTDAIGTGWKVVLSGFDTTSNCNNNTGVIDTATDYFEVTPKSTPTPSQNPLLSDSCGLDIALVIDNSNSISDSELGQMKNALKEFVDALTGTPTQFSVTKFGTNATVVQEFTSDATLTKNAINSVTTGGGGTNWENALNKARATFDPRTDKPNLIIFASDGNPTYPNCGGSSTCQNDINAAIIEANHAKEIPARILAIGVGNELKVDNLKAISGGTVNGENISTTDVITTDFAGMAAKLANFAKQTCGGTITVNKYINSVAPGNRASTGWTFNIAGTSKTTDSNGQTDAVKVSAGSGYSVTESAVLPGYTFFSATCIGATNNGSQNGNGVIGLQISDSDTVSCYFVNTRDTGTIELKKVWSGTAGQTTLKIGTSIGGSEIDSQLTGADGISDLTTGQNTVPTGTYYLSESGGLSGYNSSLSCTDNGQTATVEANNSIVVAKDHTVICTFTNTKLSLNLSVEKLDTGYDPVYIDQKIHYTINWSVTGNTTANNLHLTETINSPFTFNSTDNPGWTSTSADEWSYPLGNVAAPASGSVNIVLGVNPSFTGDLVTNTIYLLAQDPANPTGNALSAQGSQTTTILHYGSISGTKYEDIDGDGQRDTNNENALSGWTIYIDSNKNGQLDTGEPTQITGSDGSFAFANLTPGIEYWVGEVDKPGWIKKQPTSAHYEVTLGAGKNETVDFGNQRNPAKIKAYKVICDSEQYLPNWGNHGETIDQNTAQNFVTNSKGHCRLATDWKFQYGGTGSDGAFQTQTDEKDAPWKTFNVNSDAVINDLSDYGSKIEVREVFPNNTYIGFSNDAGSVTNPVSAEFYCSGDVYNYDNWEWINNPQYGQTYYCIGFNAPKYTQIMGQKFNDSDADGQKDEGETGLADWTIYAAKEVDNLTVNSNSKDMPTFSSVVLDNEQKYLIRASGTYDANDSITADAKYSHRAPNTVWTDIVQHYESYGPSLLDLQISGSSPNWGSYNPNHVYWLTYTGTGSSLNFRIYDIGNGSNNSGSLNVKIYKVLAEETTDENGNYNLNINQALEGNIIVAEKTQDGWYQTAPTGSNFGYCQVTPYASNTCNFGNTKVSLGSISGMKFGDTNGNGSKDGSESGLSGWKIQLYNTPTQISSSVVTGGDGSYSFTDLVPGYYKVCEVPQTGWKRTTPKDSDCYSGIEIKGGDTVESKDFGNYQKSDVTICKVDNKSRPQPNWDVVLVSEKVDGPTSLINVSDKSGTDSSALPAGKYLIKVSGTYRYGDSSMNADAGFSYRPFGIPSGCDCWSSGLSLPGNGLMVKINGNNVNWGAYNDDHSYTYVYDHPGDSINLSIYDNVYGDNVNDNNFKFEIYKINNGFYGETGEDGCTTITDVPYGNYILDEELKEGWVDVSGKGSPVLIDSSSENFTIVNRINASVKIIATKIVCDYEEYLPNYGKGGPNITATTAKDWVNNSKGHCWLEPDWKFQWGDDKDENPGDSVIGEAEGWNTFGPTDANGVAAVDINNYGSTSQIKVREVLKENYIPFTYTTSGNQNSNPVSAELYCDTDVLNYDNDDRFTPEYGQTYYCVAWNALKRSDIYGYKWSDLNGNGKRDCVSTGLAPKAKECDLEPLLSGWKVFIDKNGNGTWDEGEDFRITSASEPIGKYSFEQLPAGQTYKICEVPQTGWTETYPTSTTNACHSVTVPVDCSGGQCEFNFGNYEKPELSISKFNDASGPKKIGDTVEFTIKVTAHDNSVSEVHVYDLFSEGFEYVDNSWEAASNKNSGLVVGEPTYASPADWSLGSMLVGETITLTYRAKVTEDIDPGIYNDIAWTQGTDYYGGILGYAEEGENSGKLAENFVGTQVEVEKETPLETDVDVKEEKKEKEGEVLGASTSMGLPATGASTIWVKLISVIAFVGALLLLIGGLEKMFNKKKATAKSGKNVLTRLILIGLFAFVTTKAYAASTMVRLSQPKSPATSTFDLVFVAMDINSSPRNLLAECFVQKPGDLDFSATPFHTESISSGNVGDSKICPVDASVLDSEGTYAFKVKVTPEGGSSVDSNEITVEYDSIGPDKPEYIKKEKVNDCVNKIKVKTADDGETASVKVYADDDKEVDIDDSHRIETETIGPNEKFEFEHIVSGDDCDKDWYYAVVAFDSSGNASNPRAETITTYTEGETKTGEKTEEETGAIPVEGGAGLPGEGAVAGEQTGGEEGAGQGEGKTEGAGEEGSVLGEQTSEVSGSKSIFKSPWFWVGLAGLGIIIFSVSKKSKKAQR